MSWVDDLYKQEWFTNLPKEEQQTVLNSGHIDGPVPIARERTDIVADKDNQQCIMNQMKITDLELNFQKLYTLLMGEEGQGGFFSSMQKIESSLQSLTKQVEGLPKQISQEVSAAHGRIDEVKRDVDKVALIARDARDKVDGVIQENKNKEEEKKGTWSGVKQDLIVYGIKIALFLMALGLSVASLPKILENM